MSANISCPWILKDSQHRPCHDSCKPWQVHGCEMNRLLMAVEVLPTLIHVSMSLFFAGLAVFLWNVNLMILKMVLSWISICATLYGCITLIPIFWHNTPYYSPLTPLPWLIVLVIINVFCTSSYRFWCVGFCSLFMLQLWWIGPNIWMSERPDYSSPRYNKNDTREGCSQVIMHHQRSTLMP